MCKKTILFCDNNLRDLINFRGDIINNYAENGFNVILVAPYNYKYHFTYPNIKYIPIELHRSSMNPIKELRYFWKLYSIYRKERPNYIFHYTIKPNIYGSIAAHLCGIPSTAMIAGLGYVFNNKGIGNFVAQKLYRFAMKYPEHVFVLNSYNKDLILKEKIATLQQVILLPGGEGINLKQYKL